MGEFRLIERLVPYLAGAGGRVRLGQGDDAAILTGSGDDLVVTTDVLVDGVHFRRDVSSLEDVGWKAVAVNASDLAAMGARPLAAVVGLSRPAAMAEEDVERLYAGLSEACRRWDLALVGGDTVASPALSVALTALGEVEPGRGVARSGARPGDRLVLVGALGAPAAALAAIEGGAGGGDDLLAAHRRPRALVAAGRALAAKGASAMIDVSDGLGADLAHLCAASGVGAVVAFDELPVAEGVPAVAAATGRDVVRMVCGGGEDFALLAAVPADRAPDAVTAAAEAEGVPAAVIGEVVARRPGRDVVRLALGDGSVVSLEGFGYDHYAS